MKNNKTPDDSGSEWNSDDLVIEEMSCKELGRLCTSYFSALRMARQDFKREGSEGVMKLLITIFQQQLSLLNSNGLTPAERLIIEENGVVTLQAVCMAGMFASGGADPRILTAIGCATLDVVHALSLKRGPITQEDDVIVDIRKGDGEATDGSNIQMAVRTEPIAQSLAAVSNDNIGNQIKKIVKKSGGQPNLGGEFGVN